MNTIRESIKAGLPWYVIRKDAAAKKIIDRLADVGDVRLKRCAAYACSDGRVYGMGADVECAACRGTGWVQS